MRFLLVIVTSITVIMESSLAIRPNTSPKTTPTKKIWVQSVVGDKVVPLVKHVSCKVEIMSSYHLRNNVGPMFNVSLVLEKG